MRCDTAASFTAFIQIQANYRSTNVAWHYISRRPPRPRLPAYLRCALTRRRGDPAQLPLTVAGGARQKSFSTVMDKFHKDRLLLYFTARILATTGGWI